MILKFDINKYNEKSQKFIQTWLNDCETLMVLRRPSKNEQDEDYIFYRDKDLEIRIVTAPRKGTSNKPCFFGSIDYFIRLKWAEAFYNSEKYKGWTFVQLINQSWWLDRRNCLRIEKALHRMLNISK